MSSPPPPAAVKLDRSRSVLLLVDVQERLFGAVSGREELAANAARLARGAAILRVPVLATEQYPKGLGRTIPAIAGALPEDVEPVEKLAFSCLGEPAFASRFRALGRDQVVLAGIEAHVCVLQSALDLLAAGACVFVVEDAVASRTPENKRVGLARLAGAGAVAVSTEMVLFEWLGGAGDPSFREVQALVK